MTDDQQRARELLAQEYERDGITHVPDCIRREAMLTEMEHRAIRAITAALRAAPEGFVMVPVEPNEAMIKAHDSGYWDTPADEWGTASRKAWEAMLAARPQGVK